MPEIRNPNLESRGTGGGGGGGDFRSLMVFTFVALIALYGLSVLQAQAGYGDPDRTVATGSANNAAARTSAAARGEQHAASACATSCCCRELAN